MSTPSRTALGATSLLAVALVAAGCASSSTTGSSSIGSTSSGAAAGRVALLLPETATTCYESADRPYFEAALKDACPTCQLDYSNANNDSATQLQQANAALTKGAKVLVLDPVDGTTAGAIVTAAKAKNVPVISYDRLITGGGDLPQYYISFDNEKVGQLQAQTLLTVLQAAGKTGGNLVWINGSPTDNNATLFAKGAHSVIPTSGGNGYTIGYEIATPDWKPATAQTEMAAAIAKLGKGNIVGIYSANDGMAATIVAAEQQAGISPLLPLTGQDAQVDGIQRILTGAQSMTVYKAIKPEATAAAQLATQVLQGQVGTSVNGIQITQTQNGSASTPSLLLTPVTVTKDNVKSTVIADQFVKASDVCSGDATAVCTQLGIS